MNALQRIKEAVAKRGMRSHVEVRADDVMAICDLVPLPQAADRRVIDVRKGSERAPRDHEDRTVILLSDHLEEIIAKIPEGA